MKKSLLLLGCLASALTSVAKNGIIWEGPYEPFNMYTSSTSCIKNPVFLSHPRIMSECPLSSVDTVIVSDQSADINDCAHYQYKKQYYVVAKDECGNTDSLLLGTENVLVGYHPINSIIDSAEYIKNGKPIEGSEGGPTSVLTKDSINVLPIVENCVFTMPDITEEMVVEMPKCGAFAGPIKKTQDIAPGEVLEEGMIYRFYISVNDACNSLGKIMVTMNVPTRESIVSAIAPDTFVVNALEDYNLSKVFDVKGTTQVTDLDGSLIEVPSSLYSDYYRGRVYEDSLIFSNNPKTYASEYYIPERLTLKAEKDNGIYALVAMDTVSGCTDTAYSYVKVKAPNGIVWNKTDLIEKTLSLCDNKLIDIPTENGAYQATSPCSEVTYTHFLTDNQDSLETACGHYNFDIKHYKVATDSCGNADTLLYQITHIVTPEPRVSDALISAVPEYLGGCEFAVPDVTKMPLFLFETQCSAITEISQSIEPGTIITDETNVSVFFNDVCHGSFLAHSVRIPVPKKGDIKILVDSVITVKAGADIISKGNIYRAFKIWSPDLDGNFIEIPSIFNKSIYSPNGELEYPYTLNGPEDNGIYAFIATDTITGCSDTAWSYVFVDTLTASSPIVIAELSETKVDIYTPSGILLKKNVYFKDVMDELKAGIYIVNNKKYYLKK